MKFGMVILLSIMLIITPASAAETVWGPGNHYKIAFLHSGKIETEKNQVVLEFENLPVTEFDVYDFTNDGYTITYRGYEEFTYVDKLLMKKDDSGISYPNAAFPVVLPVKFDNQDDWIRHFNDYLDEDISPLNEPFNFFDSEHSIANDLLSINSTSNFDIIFGQSNRLAHLTFMDYSYLDNLKLTDARLNLHLDYNINSGTLFYLNYTLFDQNEFYGENMTSYFRMSEQLDFVAIIPPIFSIFSQLNSSFNIVTIFLLSLVMNNYTTKWKIKTKVK